MARETAAGLQCVRSGGRAAGPLTRATVWLRLNGVGALTFELFVHAEAASASPEQDEEATGNGNVLTEQREL